MLGENSSGIAGALSERETVVAVPSDCPVGSAGADGRHFHHQSGSCFLRSGGSVQAVGFSGELNDLGVVEKAVQDGCGSGDVVDELTPFFNGAVGGHEGGAVFVTAHDQLQEYFACFGWKSL